MRERHSPTFLEGINQTIFHCPLIRLRLLWLLQLRCLTCRIRRTLLHCQLLVSRRPSGLQADGVIQLMTIPSAFLSHCMICNGPYVLTHSILVLSTTARTSWVLLPVPLSSTFLTTGTAGDIRLHPSTPACPPTIPVHISDVPAAWPISISPSRHSTA